MRSDMAKVIVERPRIGHGAASQPKGYRKRLQKHGLDVTPREGMRGKWRERTKWFNEHLGPLRRYIRSQVGRPWNKVHAEICQHLRPDSVVQAHVLTHLYQYVQVHVVLRDGRPCYGEGRQFGRQLRDDWFYVCPSSGLLRLVKRKRLDNSVGSRIRGEEDRQYHQRDGVWHEVKLRPIPDEPVGCWDAWIGERVVCISRQTLIAMYGRLAYALSVRPLQTSESRQVVRTEQHRRGLKPIATHS